MRRIVLIVGLLIAAAVPLRNIYERYLWRQLYHHTRHVVQSAPLSQEALESITRLIDDSRTPDSIKALAYASRGDIYRHNDQASAAINDYGNAARLDDKYIDALRSRSLLNAEIGQHTAIVHDITIVVAKLKPVSFDYFLRARAYKELGLDNEAISDFSAAILLETNSHLLASLYDSRGHMLATQGRYKEAIEDYSAAINLNDPKYKPYLGRGYTRERLGLYSEALSDYEAGIETHNDDFIFYLMAAKLIANATNDSIKDNKRALEYAQKAVECEPPYLSPFQKSEVLEVNAQANGACSNYEISISLLEKALKLGLPEDRRETLNKQILAYKMLLMSNEKQKEGEIPAKAQQGDRD